MVACFRVSVPLCQTEVDDIYVVLAFSDADQEVVWFDVAVQEQPGVDVLDALDQLVCQHQHRLQRKLPVTESE